MTLKVFAYSNGNMVSEVAPRLRDVDRISERLKAEGATDIRVGRDWASALPYDDWKIGSAGVKVTPV